MDERQLKHLANVVDLPPPPEDDEDDDDPPPDHPGFLEARAAGFRSLRQQLARRRKKK
ncbi:MAG TPA: hypothetical protein VLK66_03320 [Longimicrobium sp.]|nr:hypothetical protein [Longimicrobium sp.]